jgi:hypothetical protein
MVLNVVTINIGQDGMTDPAEMCADPVISPVGGIYDKDIEAPISVSIQCSAPNATIYYTIDGSDPTAASTIYDGMFSVTYPLFSIFPYYCTIKAVAISPNYLLSNIVSATYVLAIEGTDEGTYGYDGVAWSTTDVFIWNSVDSGTYGRAINE